MLFTSHFSVLNCYDKIILWLFVGSVCEFNYNYIKNIFFLYRIIRNQVENQQSILKLFLKFSQRKNI